MFTCKRCENIFETMDSLRRHTGRVHKISSKDFYVEHQLNSVLPSCKCGCGETPRWNGHGFDEWRRGHISRVHNNWGHNQTAIDNSSKTRREQFKTGKRKMWNDGLTKETSPSLAKLSVKVSNDKERAKKISIILTGMKKSDEHKRKIQKFMQTYWADETHRDEQRARHIKWLCEKERNEPSTLEMDFHNALIQNGIHADTQVEVGKHLFDFKIGELLLVEVDGDFYHCNPNKGIQPTYPVQKRTVGNDKNKNMIAKKLGYTLIRIWESDFRTNPQEQIRRVLNEMSKQ